MLLYINGNYPYHSLHSELVRKLADMGNDILVFVPTRGKESHDYYPCCHQKVRILHDDCIEHFDSIFFISKIHKIAKHIEDQVNLSEVDCILAGTLYSDGAVAYLLHKKYHIPFSVAVRGTDVTFQMKYRPYLNGLIKRLLGQTEKVIFLAPSYMKHFNKFRIDQNKIAVIPNAVNDYWFEQQKKVRIPHVPISIIFVGEIQKNKNVSSIILAVSELNKRNVDIEFHVIGSGPEESGCQALAKKLSIEKKVFFHGWQNGKEKIKQYYEQADIFVMLSFRETFGTVYIEALSQGLPLIYTRGQGIDGYFEEGRIGYSCNPTDIEEIVNKIIKVLDHYSEISRYCIDHSSIFMWETVANQYQEIITDMRRK